MEKDSLVQNQRKKEYAGYAESGRPRMTNKNEDDYRIRDKDIPLEIKAKETVCRMCIDGGEPICAMSVRKLFCMGRTPDRDRCPLWGRK